MPLGGSTAVICLSRSCTRSARPGGCQFLPARSALHTTPAIASSVRIRVGAHRPVDVSIPTRRSRREDQVSGVQRAGRRDHRRALRLRRLRTAYPRRTGEPVGQPVAQRPRERRSRAVNPKLPDIRGRLCRRARQPFLVSFPAVVRPATVRPNTVTMTRGFITCQSNEVRKLQ